MVQDGVGSSLDFLLQEVNRARRLLLDNVTHENAFEEGLGNRSAMAAYIARRILISIPVLLGITVAGFVFVGGSLVALWPDAREERRLAARYAQPVTVKA